jgi:hypothetical protein
MPQHKIEIWVDSATLDEGDIADLFDLTCEGMELSHPLRVLDMVAYQITGPIKDQRHWPRLERLANRPDPFEEA